MTEDEIPLRRDFYAHRTLYLHPKPKLMKLFRMLFFVLLCSTTQAQGYITLDDSIAALPVLNQGSSPICWDFASNSLFESDLLRTQHRKIIFSLMYFVRQTYIDKIKLFLATKGKIFIDGGGQFHDIIRVINEYGILPEEVYPYKYRNSFPDIDLEMLDTATVRMITDGRKQDKIGNQDKLDNSMEKISKKFLTLGKNFLNKKDLKQLNDSLDKYCGKLPATFVYNKKRYTAKTFAKNFIHFKNNYIEVMAFSDLPLYRMSVLKDKYNWASDSFYNVTMDDMKMLVDTALHKGWSVGWEGGVTGAGFNGFKGYARYDSLPQNLDEQRSTDFKDLKLERDHMMHIVGEGLDSLNKKWYYVKNSWGTESGIKGYLFMDENYLKLKTVILYVNKEGLPLELKRKLGSIEKK
jgi:bleomycin hydrolase